MKTILIVGDEEESHSVCSILASNDHVCCHVKLEEIILNEIPNPLDLILILDNGSAGRATRLCKEIRTYSMVPIVIILKEASPSDVVDALRNGADDCLPSPLHHGELLARMEAVLRRKTNRKSDANRLVLNRDTHEARYLDHRILFAPREFSILDLLVKQCGKVVSLNEIISSISEEKVIKTATVHSYIRSIREKLRSAGFPADVHLLSVWGKGYRWDRCT
ncbi:response regulator transcription factor [Mesobacillus foraminis]|uniref:response regulator transcription factor n=1 Tax=Mesobacillus foraminis TaxID=279826 RepID=UPI001BE6C6C0|nr:response regulator transcription factor [Mesobacillus foraminis]MBT2758793.1 response regulator transcription factor [Mesobacillus foraminis]